MTEDNQNELKIGTRMPDGSIYAGVSPATNRPMYVSPHDQFGSFDRMAWGEAVKAAKEKDAHGHKDWRLPICGEVSVLFNNRAAIRVFNATNANEGGNYWMKGELSFYFPGDPRKDGGHMQIWQSHGLGTNAVRFVRS
ncbi:MAG: hypothetical protein K8R48_04970 [Alphaproteobacteria bacterium]|nr:hypothetical protein [Alphaproteobacteria bacterium]